MCVLSYLRHSKQTIPCVVLSKDNIYFKGFVWSPKVPPRRLQLHAQTVPQASPALVCLPAWALLSGPHALHSLCPKSPVCVGVFFMNRLCVP